MVYFFSSSLDNIKYFSKILFPERNLIETVFNLLKRLPINISQFKFKVKSTFYKI